MTNQKRMLVKQFIFIAMLVVVLVLAGINYFIRPFEKYFAVKEIREETLKKTQKQEHLKPLTNKEVFEQLSVEEKVAQMIAYPLTIEDDQVNKEEGVGTSYVKNKALEVLSPGFITIFGSKISSSSAKQKITKVKKLYQDSILLPKFAVDHEGGRVQRLSGKGYTVLPSWKEVCSLEQDKAINLLKKSASELKNTGIDIVLAPVLDVGNSSFLKDRVCSNSYATVADMSIKYITIFNTSGVLPVLKHFPGIGSIQKDLHTNFDSVRVLDDDAKLYKYVIEQSAKVAVMIAHAGVVNQDSKVPCSLSADCVGELKNVYPQLLIFSDALEMKSASFDKQNINEPKSLVKVSKEAVSAGNEVLLYGQDVSFLDIKNVVSALSSEYKKSIEFKKLVDQAVFKIIDYKRMKK